MLVKVYNADQKCSHAWPLDSVTVKPAEPFRGKFQAAVSTGTVAGGFYFQGSAKELRVVAEGLIEAASRLDILESHGRLPVDPVDPPPPEDGLSPRHNERATVEAGRKPDAVRVHVFKIVENQYQRYYVATSNGVVIRGKVNGTMKVAIAAAQEACRYSELFKVVKMKGSFSETQADKRIKELHNTYGIKS